MGRELLTQSRIKSFRACRRKHKHDYIDLRRRKGTAPALRFGSLAHIGLEAWNNPPYTYAAAIDAVHSAWADYPDTDEFEMVAIESCLAGYDLRYMDQPHTVVATELPFEVPLRNPATGGRSRTFDLAGKIDAIYEINGECWIVEHKTTTADIGPGSDYWLKLALDEQVTVYILAAQAMGFDVVGCLYDVLRKPKLKPLKATPKSRQKWTKTEPARLHVNQREHDETPEEYRVRCIEAISANPGAFYRRGNVIRLADEIESYRYDLWQTAEEMRESMSRKRFPRNPQACQDWNRYCDYWPVCTRQARLSDPLFIDKAGQHEELQEKDEQAKASATTGENGDKVPTVRAGGNGQDDVS